MAYLMDKLFPLFVFLNYYSFYWLPNFPFFPVLLYLFLAVVRWGWLPIDLSIVMQGTEQVQLINLFVFVWWNFGFAYLPIIFYLFFQLTDENKKYRGQAREYQEKTQNMERNLLLLKVFIFLLCEVLFVLVKKG